MAIWTRLCVDLDGAGNPIGTSWERHVGERITGFGTGPLPEPFDPPAAAFGAILSFAVAELGVQPSLATPLLGD